MALKNKFKTKHGIDLADAYLKLEYIGFAVTHHKQKDVMVAHYQVFVSEQAYLNGNEFIDTLDTEVPYKADLMEHVYLESKKLPEFKDAIDVL